jgi:hypothetical protein
VLTNYLTRPGFKTSEFLVALLTAVGAVVSWTQDYVSSGTGVKLSVGAGIAYVLSRGLAKYETRTTTTTATGATPVTPPPAPIQGG